MLGRTSGVGIQASQAELLDRIFRDPSIKQGLKFFVKGERNKIALRESQDGKVEIYCAKREKWFRAKPEEVVRQLFLIWVQDTLKYPLSVVEVEWAIQNARVVLQCMQMRANEISRDRSMAENVKWIADQNPAAKIVLWAHNGHVSTNASAGSEPMGASLRKMFGGQMVVFGFAF